MNKMKFIVLLIISCAILFTSCNSDDAREPVDTTPINSIFTVTINGEPFTATHTNATLADGILAITGTSINGDSVILKLQRSTPGEYYGSFMVYRTADGHEFINAAINATYTNGKVEITSMQPLKSGTFDFTAYDPEGVLPPKVFTNGHFSLPISSVEQSSVEGGVTLSIDTAYRSFTAAVMLSVNGEFVLSGRDHHGMILINMGDMLEPGTYPISGVVDDAGYATITNNPENSSGYPAINSVAGTYTITDNSDGWLTGTFSYTAEINGNPVQVTGGTFTAQIQE